MSWLNEIQWFLLVVLIMKVLILGALAAWAVTIIANRPCSEYCIYLSAGVGDPDFLPVCDCVYRNLRPSDLIDESSIYFEPTDYLPATDNIYNHPFYILNPILHRTRNLAINNDADIAEENIRSSLNSRRHNAEIEINVENTRTASSRQSPPNIQIPNVPIYLDVDFDSEDEQSASRNSFPAEEVNEIEQTLAECASLHALLHAKNNLINNDITTATTKVSEDHGHLSRADLEKKIDSKCSHMSHIFENSLNEIKQTQPKKPSANIKTNKEAKRDNEILRILKTNKATACVSTSEENLETLHHKSKKQECSENHEQTKNLSDENKSSFKKSSLEVPLTTATSTASTSPLNINISTDFNKKNDDVTETTTERSKEQNLGKTPVYTENQYPLQTETISSLLTTASTLELSSIPEYSTAITKSVEHENSENQLSEGRMAHREPYKEGDMPVTKIITHEFGNNTVQSYINGTEDVLNDDFKNVTISAESENLNEISPLPQTTNAISVELETTEATTTANAEKVSPEDISGSLYFVFNNHQIPARFIQNHNGSLHVGIDGGSLCKILTEDGDRTSALLTTLCDCYKSGDCKQKKNN